jgi:hypothetical protein
VRGRRFVRPTLTLTHHDAAVRALADLEHKPWAAEDGEVWIAVFSIEEAFDEAREIELSVAPDIVVELRPKGKRLARPGDTLSAGAAARAPRYKNDAPEMTKPPMTQEAPPAGSGRRRPPSHNAELERLGSRLASANQALEQERERRGALAKTIEDERSATRQLRTELGQARVELEVAAAARAEAAAVEAELEDARRQLRERERDHEQDTTTLSRRHEEAHRALTHQHERVTEAHAALQEQLQQQTAALESTREALAAERAESGRLRHRLNQVQETRQRPGSLAEAAGAAAAGAGAATRAGAAEPRVSRRASSRAAARERDAERERSPSQKRSAARESREADPTTTQPFDVLSFEEPGPAPSGPPRSTGRRGGQPQPEQPAWSMPAPERLRPINPSLRHRTWWFGRLLVLIVLLGVAAAVYLVLHTTVLH